MVDDWGNNSFLLHVYLFNTFCSPGCWYFRSLKQPKIHSDLSPLQPDDDSNYNDDDDDENAVPLDVLPPTLKITRLQRRQTIAGFQSQPNRTAFQQLHAMFWPAREVYSSRLADERIDEDDQRPMISGDLTSTVQRSSDSREKTPSLMS